jgi:hypothetical protein
MSPDCNSDTIPKTCADAFRSIEHRLTGIEIKQDALLENQRASRGRVWEIAKMILASIVGGVVAILTTSIGGGGKH